MGSPRFDFVFSYWVLSWYILYELKVIQYNPEPAFLFGILENIIYLLLMFFYKNSAINIILFIVINVLIKVIPFYRLRNTTYGYKDIGFTVFLFLLWTLWLRLNDVNIKTYYTDSVNAIKTNNPKTPGMYYIKKFWNI